MNETHALPPGESHRPIQERAENAILQAITTRLTSEEAVTQEVIQKLMTRDDR